VKAPGKNAGWWKNALKKPVPHPHKKKKPSVCHLQYYCGWVNDWQQLT